MINFRGINKLKVVMPALITVALLILLFLTLLASVDYDIVNFKWGDFAFSIFYWISGRVTYFPLGNDIGELNPDVKICENTISKYRKLIYQKKVNKLVSDKFKERNVVSKVSAYIDELDIKLNKLSDKQSKKKIDMCNKLLLKREQAMDYLDKFQKKQKYTGKFNPNNIRVKYDILDFGTCFSYGANNRLKGKKYRINIQTEGVSKSIPSFIWSISLSVLSATTSILSYGFTFEALYVFFIKLVLFLLGCFNGLTLGKSVIEENKYNVLLNITHEIKEVITEIEQEQNIIIDEKD